MDIDETARQLGITPDGVRKRIARGSLQATKMGGRWDIVLDTGQDTTRPSLGQSDISIGQQDRDVLIQSFQSQIEILREQLLAMNKQISSQSSQITELTTVIRQQQAALPPPAAERKSWWKRLWEG